MAMPEKQLLAQPTLPFYIRKLAKSGGTRYLSLGTILPVEWEACKVTVEKLTGDVCILKLERIK